MKAKKYYLSILPLAMLVAGCAKTVPNVPDVPGPEVQTEEFSDDLITMNLRGHNGTKAFVTKDNLATDGNRFQVYDFYVGSENYPISYFNRKDGTGVLGEGEWITANDGKWGFYEGSEYKWTVSGSHNFFGWLIKDAIDSDNKLEAPAITLDKTNPFSRKIVYPTTTLTKDSPIFDFMYSNVISRKMTGLDDNHNPVELRMDHLFSALEFGAENKIDQKVTIKSLKVYGLKNTNSATITFPTPAIQSGDRSQTIDAICEYGEGTKAADNAPIVIFNGELVLNPKTAGDGTDVVDLVGGKSMLMWPHYSNDTVEDLKPAHEFGNDPDTGEAFWDASDPIIVATYVIEGQGEITRPVAFPLNENGSGKYMSLNPGERHHVVISFVDKLMQLKLQVLPWQYEETVINYSEGTIQASSICQIDGRDYKIFYDYDRLTSDADGKIVIDNTKGQSSVDDAAKKVTVKDGMPVKVRFRLNTPQGAKWFVSLKGDINAFTVQKLTDNEVDGTNCDFQLVPSTSAEYASPKRDYEVTLRISIQLPDGRIVSADDILLQDQYTIVLPKAS